MFADLLSENTLLANSKRIPCSPFYFLAILKDLTLEFEVVVFDVTVKVAVQSTPGIRLEIEAVKGDVKLE